jgi:diketogulonate reductase-like aldo/keto reductase
MATKRSFGPTRKEVPIIGQGTWKMGAPADRAREIRALQAGLDAGLTHIDTAELYGNGQAEVMIAEAIAGRKRDELFIVSKVMPSNASHGGTIAACEASLKRLKTDYLDCYLLHWVGRHPIAETMHALEDLVKQGKIRSLGVSNFGLRELEQARSALKKEHIACNQVLYNLVERDIESDVIPFCEKHDIAVVGYTPFGRLDEIHPALVRVARARGATVRQIVLAFLARRAFQIPKASNPEHAAENAGALGMVLADEEIAAIDSAFPG